MPCGKETEEERRREERRRSPLIAPFSSVGSTQTQQPTAPLLSGNQPVQPSVTAPAFAAPASSAIGFISRARPVPPAILPSVLTHAQPPVVVLSRSNVAGVSAAIRAAVGLPSHSNVASIGVADPPFRIPDPYVEKEKSSADHTCGRLNKRSAAAEATIATAATEDARRRSSALTKLRDLEARAALDEAEDSGRALATTQTINSPRSPEALCAQPMSVATLRGALPGHASRGYDSPPNRRLRSNGGGSAAWLDEPNADEALLLFARSLTTEITDDDTNTGEPTTSSGHLIAVQAQPHHTKPSSAPLFGTAGIYPSVYGGAVWANFYGVSETRPRGGALSEGPV